MEPQHVETILGYPVHHTLPAGSDPVERVALLKHSFQTDTLGYHISSLKSIFRDGITLLSIYSGIGGAEIAVHKLGVRLKGVVSVESSEVNRKILKRWWENSGQTGKLVQLEGINKMTGSMVKSLVTELGGFDLVVCQSRLVDPENPTGFDFAPFYEFTRVLQAVRSCMGCS
ncbi:DNA (cytosine-5-)-methyltransferase [Ranunculus cassubicifolius]